MKRYSKFLLARVLVPAMVWAVFAGTTVAPITKTSLAGYNVIVVEEFDIEQTQKTLRFSPRMLNGIRSEVIDRLQGERLFEEVIDATPVATSSVDSGSGSQAGNEATPGEGRLLLSGTVFSFKKGSRAKRALIGFGSGASVVRVRFIFRDGETGTELLRTERKGKFSGWISFAGGQSKEAMAEAAGDVVDGLIKVIKKNR